MCGSTATKYIYYIIYIYEYIHIIPVAELVLVLADPIFSREQCSPGNLCMRCNAAPPIEQWHWFEQGRCQGKSGSTAPCPWEHFFEEIAKNKVIKNT